MNRRTKVLLSIIILGIVIFIVLGILVIKNNNKKPDGNSDIRETQIDNQSEESGANKKNRQTGIPIDTPYGELFFSEEWNDFLEVKVSDKTNYTIAFYTNLEKEKIKLFSVVFGSDSKGELLGTIDDQWGETREVSIIINELKGMENISEENRDVGYAMQEEVNDIIEQIYQFNGFQPVRG